MREVLLVVGPLLAATWLLSVLYNRFLGPRMDARRFGDRGRILRTLPTGPIAPDLADGAAVKVVGAARPAEGAVTAPLSGRRCCAYVATVERFVEQDVIDPSATALVEDHAIRSTMLARDEATADFLVETPTETVRVAATAATLDLARGHRVDLDGDLPRAFLARYSLSFGPSLRAFEARIEDGVRIAVLGHARWDRSGPAPRLTLVSDGELRVLVSDEDWATR